MKPFELAEVIDGSTFTGWIDLGLDIKIRKKIRLVNVKCHNTKVSEGRDSKEFVEQLLKNKKLTVKTFKDRFRKYSTVLVVLYAENGNGQCINVNDELVKMKMGVDVRGEFEEE